MGTGPFSTSAQKAAHSMLSPPALPGVREEAKDASSGPSPRAEAGKGQVGSKGASAGGGHKATGSTTTTKEKGHPSKKYGPVKAEKCLKARPANANAPKQSTAQPQPLLLRLSADYLSPAAFQADVVRKIKLEGRSISSLETADDQAQVNCTEAGCGWAIVVKPKEGRWAVSTALSSTIHTHGVGKSFSGGGSTATSSRSRGWKGAESGFSTDQAPKDVRWALYTKSGEMRQLVESRSTVFNAQRSYTNADLLSRSQNLAEAYISTEEARIGRKPRHLIAALAAWEHFCSYETIKIPSHPLTPSLIALFAFWTTVHGMAFPSEHVKALDELRLATASAWKGQLRAEDRLEILSDFLPLGGFLQEYEVDLEDYVVEPLATVHEPKSSITPRSSSRLCNDAQATKPGPPPVPRAQPPFIPPQHSPGIKNHPGDRLKASGSAPRVAALPQPVGASAPSKAAGSHRGVGDSQGSDITTKGASGKNARQPRPADSFAASSSSQLSASSTRGRKHSVNATYHRSDSSNEDVKPVVPIKRKFDLVLSDDDDETDRTLARSTTADVKNRNPLIVIKRTPQMPPVVVHKQQKPPSASGASSARGRGPTSLRSSTSSCPTTSLSAQSLLIASRRRAFVRWPTCAGLRGRRTWFARS